MTDHDAAAIQAAAEVQARYFSPCDETGPDAEDLHVARMMLDAARPHLAAAERERIAQLAEQHGAVCARQHGQPLQVTTTGTVTAWDDGRLPDVVPFAALIRAEPAAPEVGQQRIVICRCTQHPELGPCPHNRQAAP